MNRFKRAKKDLIEVVPKGFMSKQEIKNLINWAKQKEFNYGLYTANGRRLGRCR